MIFHLVFFNIKDSVKKEDIETFMLRFSELGSLPDVISFEILQNPNPEKYQFLAISNFDDNESLGMFNSSVEHKQFLDECWGDVVSDFSVQDMTSYRNYKKS